MWSAGPATAQRSSTPSWRRVRPSRSSVDLSTPAGPAALAAVALARGAIDILINNVGGAHPRVGGFLSITDEDWAATINLNLMAAVRMTAPSCRR